MPKIHNTRRQRATALFKKLENGPAFPNIETMVQFQDSPAKAYRRWAESWILDELTDLIPELRAIKKESGNAQ